ncbi:uncharacterized protein LOC134192553 [Corticium candelabrum]|uniref:uncharacterized protein LOC134192553 n=1 Tax=Corticium candelabrum TaxID=121492 RepID=UPI002E26D129|nr:uncharacterized protein LOC134192553 [Corticium candelabrum]
MTNDFPSFCFASHRSSVSLGVGRSSACATLPVADNSLLLASRRLANSELTANWKALSPSIPLGKPNEALAFLRRNLEDFSGHTVRDVEKCDILPTISELLTYPNHPEFYLTSDEWSDLVTPVMLAQRQHLLNGNDKLLGNCLTAFSGPRDSGCAGLVVHPTGNNMSCINVSLLCSECCESPLSESSESNQSTSGIDSDSDSRSGIEEGIPNTGLQKWKLVTHQKWETGWEIHQINSTEVADARVIGVRTDYGCSFFKGPSCKQMTQAHEEYMAEFEDINDTHILDSDLISPFGALKSKSRLMHVSMSPHIFGDAVISTAREGLYLWSPESSLQTVRTYDPVLVGYDEKWTQCYFSAHPRQIWMATRRLVEKIDCRTSNSSLQLLSSSPDVMKNVSVLQSQLLRQFCVLFATKKHIALVDERFPSQPLLLWDHGLQRAPCFLEVQTVHEGDSSTGCYHILLVLDVCDLCTKLVMKSCCTCCLDYHTCYFTRFKQSSRGGHVDL